MADPDAPAWILDDIVDETPVDNAEEVTEDVSVEAKPVEAPKPPAEWRKTYKLAVSYFETIIQY